MNNYNPFVNMLLMYSLIMSASLAPTFYEPNADKMRHGGNNRKSTHARSIQICGNKMIRHYRIAS